MRKLKSVFLCRRPEKVEEVYTLEQRREIAEFTDLRPGVVTPEEIASTDLSQVEAVFSTWGMPCLTDEQLDRMPKLEAVFYAAGATDGFARPLFARGVRIVSAWRANAIPVAEFVLGQILLAMKNCFSIAPRLRSREAWRSADAGPGCYGETIALIGNGAIAQYLAGLLEHFELKVIVVSSRRERRTVSLEEAFRTAYVVSNHLPNRADNQKVLGEELFASMRHNATFINTGRGAQVDEAGLIRVLKKRPDLTALLDVTDHEPPDDDSELYRLPNVFLTPHIAGSLHDEVHRMAQLAIDECRRYAAGEPLQHEVTEEMLMTS
jgi:phosphoglycerate dehydrogenase-like enzyme